MWCQTFLHVDNGLFVSWDKAGYHDLLKIVDHDERCLYEAIFSGDKINDAKLILIREKWQRHPSEISIEMISKG